MRVSQSMNPKALEAILRGGCGPGRGQAALLSPPFDAIRRAVSAASNAQIAADAHNWSALIARLCKPYRPNWVTRRGAERPVSRTPRAHRGLGAGTTPTPRPRL